jgi:hypothetical protein
MALAVSLAAVPAQEIANPGFEEPSLEAKNLQMATGVDTHTPEEGWIFGLDAGICRAGGSYAEGVEAAEGSQVAFLKGVSASPETSGRGAPSGVFGAKLRGLEAGAEYEIEWVQTGSMLEGGMGAVTTIITDPEKPGSRIANMNRVETKGEWVKCSMKFRATSPVMQLHLAHSLPGISKGQADGSEVTLLDDFRICRLE